jgi:hypothetical protein
MNENLKSEWTGGHSHLECKSEEKGVNKHPRGCEEGHLPQAFLQGRRKISRPSGFGSRETKQDR